MRLASRRLDHPRSRGVYSSAMRSLIALRGSSPLARGLLRAGHRIGTARRIIPARAGFTLTPPGATVADPGSSPLARGLRPRIPTDRSVAGIIPARAGFTPMRLIRASQNSDHPRSRGVYPCASARRSSGPGSSPLARGLPARFADVNGQFRIIPARAGFTIDRQACASAWADHPRSRGVYKTAHRTKTTLDGSSPLARGLLGQAENVLLELRIIPARAGFTCR